MIGPVVLLAAMAAEPAGCADHWQVVLDEESFADNGAGVAFAADSLEEFRSRLEANLRHAIGSACENGIVDAMVAADIRDVLVHSASGSTEPHFYAAGDRALHFEWAFAEENLAVPPETDIVAGLECWIDPEGPSCGAMGD